MINLPDSLVFKIRLSSYDRLRIVWYVKVVITDLRGIDSLIWSITCSVRLLGELLIITVNYFLTITVLKYYALLEFSGRVHTTWLLTLPLYYWACHFVDSSLSYTTVHLYYSYVNYLITPYITILKYDLLRRLL